MGVMEDRIHIRIRMKCYVEKGVGKKVKEIAQFILDNHIFYVNYQYDIPINIVYNITQRFDLKYTEVELLQYIWDNGLTYIYPLDFTKYATHEVIEEISAEDSPV